MKKKLPKYVRSDISYFMKAHSKPLVWLYGEVKTPPFSFEARLEAGFLLRCLQEGEKLSMPHSRPMPSIGSRSHVIDVCRKRIKYYEDSK